MAICPFSPNTKAPPNNASQTNMYFASSSEKELGALNTNRVITCHVTSKTRKAKRMIHKVRKKESKLDFVLSNVLPPDY